VLAESLSDCECRVRGRLLVIEGPAGWGKSQLLLQPGEKQRPPNMTTLARARPGNSSAVSPSVGPPALSCRILLRAAPDGNVRNCSPARHALAGALPAKWPATISG